MSPISAENKARYPKDWKTIAASIRERAGNRCEWEGCGVENGTFGYRLDCGKFIRTQGLDADVAAEDGYKIIRIVLTVAHLDHTPENCDPSNLKAWCQKHHLAYDHAHHQRNSSATRAAKPGQADLFKVENTPVTNMPLTR